MNYLSAMGMRIRSAIATNIAALVEFQREDWFEDYREIIPAGYAEYAMGLYGTTDALRRQIERGNLYLVMEDAGTVIACATREDLGTQIKGLLHETEYKYVKNLWVKQLIESGIGEKEAKKWAAEIGHVIDEYQSSLMRLVDLMQETDPMLIPQRIHSWAVGRLEVTIPEIEDRMKYLAGELQKYLPEEEDKDAD